MTVFESPIFLADIYTKWPAYHNPFPKAAFIATSPHRQLSIQKECCYSRLSSVLAHPIAVNDDLQHNNLTHLSRHLAVKWVCLSVLPLVV